MKYYEELERHNTELNTIIEDQNKQLDYLWKRLEELMVGQAPGTMRLLYKDYNGNGYQYVIDAAFLQQDPERILLHAYQEMLHRLLIEKKLKQ